MSITGLWKVIIKTPIGNDEVTFDLQENDGQISGWVMGPKGSTGILGGKAEGKELQWTTKVTFPMPMTLEFKATCDGDHISGGAKSPFGTATFSGSRTAASA